MNTMNQQLIDLITARTEDGTLQWTSGTYQAWDTMLSGFRILYDNGTLSATKNGERILNEKLPEDSDRLGAYLSRLDLKKELLEALQGQQEATSETWLDPDDGAFKLMDVPDTLVFKCIIDRELTADEVDLVTGAIGYVQRVHIRAEDIWVDHFYHTEGTTEIIVEIDLTKSVRDDVSSAFPYFWRDCEDYIKDGKYHKTSSTWLGLPDLDVNVTFKVKV